MPFNRAQIYLLLLYHYQLITILNELMDNNFSSQVKEIISFSREEALRLGNDFIGTEHLLLGLIREGDNTAVRILKSFNVDLYELRKEVELAVKDKTGKNIANINSLPLTKQAEKVIRVTVLEAKALKSPTVETEHLMLSILKNKENIATQILNQFDVDYDLFRQELGMVKSNDIRAEYQEEGDEDFDDEKKYSGSKSRQAGATKSKTPVLDNFGRDITKLAESGTLDPIVGRESEIERVSQILSRRKKNNPILIGEPGVGKTAIAEGLAHRIVSGDIPENLKSKKIYSLDMGSLIAGAKYKGEFEERLKSVVKEVTSAEGDIVLFIDEIHTLVGAGGGEGAMDAANILKPALARGELRAIGATTLDEYQKYFEKDKALERRFQKVMVDEPDTESAGRDRRPLWLDRQVLPEREELQGVFAWRLSSRGLQRIRGVYRRGDIVVISPAAWSPDNIHPRMVFAVRYEGEAVLGRVSWTGAQLVLHNAGVAPPAVDRKAFFMERDLASKMGKRLRRRKPQYRTISPPR